MYAVMFWLLTIIPIIGNHLLMGIITKEFCSLCFKNFVWGEPTEHWRDCGNFLRQVYMEEDTKIENRTVQFLLGCILWLIESWSRWWFRGCCLYFSITSSQFPQLILSHFAGFSLEGTKWHLSMYSNKKEQAWGRHSESYTCFLGNLIWGWRKDGGG